MSRLPAFSDLAILFIYAFQYLNLLQQSHLFVYIVLYSTYIGPANTPLSGFDWTIDTLLPPPPVTPAFPEESKVLCVFYAIIQHDGYCPTCLLSSIIAGSYLKIIVFENNLCTFPYYLKRKTVG